MPKRVLLTGSTGLIGSEAVRHLSQRGHELITVGIGEDNVIAGIDLAFGRLLAAVECEVDVVVHLAARIPGKDNADVHEINKKIDDNVFEYTAETGVPLIFASSGSVYGSKYQQSEMNESLRCYPEIEYSKQKLASEEIISLKLRDHYILRITAPYGPSDRYQGVLGVFCKAVINNENIVLYGDGSRCQDFIHVSDAAHLIGQIIENAGAPGIYNVASGSPTSMRDAAEIVLKTADTESHITYSDGHDPQANFKARYNIQKAVNEFHWHPSVTLETGVRELLQYFNG
jgi:UDP-glucose 4-epimerase